MKQVKDSSVQSAVEVLKAFRMQEKQRKIEEKKKEYGNILGRCFKYDAELFGTKIEENYVYVEKVLDDNSILVRSFDITRRQGGIIESAYFSKRAVGLITQDLKKEIPLEQYQKEITEFFRNTLDELEIDIRKDYACELQSATNVSEVRD